MCQSSVLTTFTNIRRNATFTSNGLNQAVISRAVMFTNIYLMSIYVSGLAKYDLYHLCVDRLRLKPRHFSMYLFQNHDLFMSFEVDVS